LEARQHEPGADRLDQVAAFLAGEAELRRTLVDPACRVRPEAREPELAHREEEHGLDPIERPLRARVERAQALDRVADEFEPDGTLVPGREDVDDAAAQREVARILDQRDPVIAPFRYARRGDVGRG